MQGLIDLHRFDVVRILDFPHFAEHISKLLETLEQGGMHFPSHMLDRCLHVLKHRGPHPLLRMSERLPTELAERERIREHLGYLRKREGLMRYPHFQQQGWPIGSGMVESANKLVVQARLAGAGMHWERSNVKSMLALRNGVCNQRWQEMWQLVVAQQHSQQIQRRTARTEQRKRAMRSSCDPVPVAPAEPAPLRIPPAPAAKLPGSCRPSAHHP